MRNMLLVSECVAKAALQRTESRGGHTRDDHPGDGRELAQHAAGLPGRPRRRPRAIVPDVTVDPEQQLPMRPDLLACFELSELEKYYTDANWPSTRNGRAEPWLHYDANLRVWRGDDAGGELKDYTVEVNDGEVVLDIIHRLQATQASDLAVRWNCKAGKCGSCSAEINGRPRLMCMTRMSTFDRGRDRHDHAAADLPGDARPGHRRVVQLRQGARRSRRSRRRRICSRASTGCSRRTSNRVAGVPQVHRVLPVPEHLPRGPRPRGEQAGVRRPAVPDAGRRAGHAPAGRRWTASDMAQDEFGLGLCNITKCCTEVCPEHIKITDNALIPMKERVADRKYDPIVWLGNKLFKR